MINFTVKVSDIPIGVSALYDETAEKFRDYMTGDVPHYTYRVTRDDILTERCLTVERRKIEPSKVCPETDAEYEWQYIYHKIAQGLPDNDSLLFHGSAVSLDGEGYLFCAPSGTGKSTHSALWKSLFGDRAVIINDDRPILKCTDCGVTIFGSPWMGKHQIGKNMSVPLKALCLLERGGVNHAERTPPVAAFPSLMKHCYRNINRTEKILNLLEIIAMRVPLYKMSCNMDPDAARAIYDDINSNKNQ